METAEQVFVLAYTIYAVVAIAALMYVGTRDNR
jgi:hypothetical protein